MENTETTTNATAFVQVDNNGNLCFVEQGWQCPICKAVMSPKERTCVNCKGMSIYGTTTTFPETVKFIDVNNTKTIS